MLHLGPHLPHQTSRGHWNCFVAAGDEKCINPKTKHNAHRHAGGSVCTPTPRSPDPPNSALSRCDLMTGSPATWNVLQALDAKIEMRKGKVCSGTPCCGDTRKSTPYLGVEQLHLGVWDCETVTSINRCLRKRSYGRLISALPVVEVLHQVDLSLKGRNFFLKTAREANLLDGEQLPSRLVQPFEHLSVQDRVCAEQGQTETCAATNSILCSNNECCKSRQAR